jgi:hypothetical protein
MSIITWIEFPLQSDSQHCTGNLPTLDVICRSSSMFDGDELVPSWHEVLVFFQWHGDNNDALLPLLLPVISSSMRSLMLSSKETCRAI